jgi:hypothetical protein
MKTKMIFFFILLPLFQQSGYSAEPIDFSKINWGMTPDDVLKAEDSYFLTNHTIKEIAPGNIILSAPETKIAGIDSVLSYTFINERLTSAAYWFVPPDRFKSEHTKELFFNDYKLAQEYLEKYYGKPDEVIGEWKCQWNKEKTVIIHLIQEQLGDASHAITFYDIKFWEEMKKIGLSD